MKTARDRFDEMVSLYLDEALDAEGVEELSRLLVARADLGARFVRLGRVHGGLRELEKGTAASTPVRNRPRPRRSIVPYVWVGILGAAAALAVLLYLFLGGSA